MGIQRTQNWNISWSQAVRLPICSSSLHQMKRQVSKTNIFFSFKLISKPHLIGNPTTQVPVKDNIYWKELAVLLSVWVAFLAVQIVKVRYHCVMMFREQYSIYVLFWGDEFITPCMSLQTYATNCSTEYWVLNALQVKSCTDMSNLRPWNTTNQHKLLNDSNIIYCVAQKLY